MCKLQLLLYYNSSSELYVTDVGLAHNDLDQELGKQIINSFDD